MAQAPAALGAQAAAAPVNRVSLPFLRIQERRLLLAAVDACIVFLVMAGAYDVWRVRVHPAADNMATTPWGWVVGGMAVWLCISWLAGAYELRVADRFSSALRNTLTVTLFSGMLALGAYWAFLKTFPRPALGLALVAVPAAVLLWRGVYATTLRRPVDATRALVLGGRASFETLLEAGQTRRDYYQLVGFISPTDDEEGSLGSVASLESAMARYSTHRVVVAPRVTLSDDVMAALTRAIERGVEVVDFNSAYEEMAGKVAVEHAQEQWLAALPTRPQTSSLEDLVMRVLDVAGSIFGLCLTVILFPVIAAAIVLGSRGSPLYAQERVGRSGRVFTVHKFRTMRIGAEANGARWARPDDDRVTRAGRFLRRTHLDELPQFWNVLRGEMSLVGPRPERPEFTESLSREIPFYRLRLSVRPGLTGLKQITVGYASSPEEHLEVLRHDLYYIKHRSLALNLTLMARTLGSVFGRNGR